MKTTNFFSMLLFFSFLSMTTQAQVMRVINNKVGVLNNNPSYHMDVNGDIRGNWIRSVGNRGLFSQTHGTYLTPTSASWWNFRSNNGVVIRNKSNVIKGYVYHNNSNGFGLLDGDGNWSMRIERDNYTQFAINNTIRMVLRANGRLEVPNGSDATGSNNSGFLQIGNALRIDNNEMITNNNSILFLQHDNNGDLRVDNTTFRVDASANTVSTPKIIDASNGAYYLDPSSVSRMNYVYPRVSNVGYIGSNGNRWLRGYFVNMHRVNEWVLSDRRLKENIENIDSALDKILAIDGKKYNYINSVTEGSPEGDVKVELPNELDIQAIESSELNNKTNESSAQNELALEQNAPELISEESSASELEKDLPFEDALISERDQKSMESQANTKNANKKTFGFIAQDVKDVLPEVVNYDEANDTYSMSYTALIPLLVESIKIQQEQIEQQQNQIDELRKMIKK